MSFPDSVILFSIGFHMYLSLGLILFIYLFAYLFQFCPFIIEEFEITPFQINHSISFSTKPEQKINQKEHQEAQNLSNKLYFNQLFKCFLNCEVI